MNDIMIVRAKNIFLLLIVVLFFISCVRTDENFTRYNWLFHHKIYDEDFNPILFEVEVFRNDSVISFSENLSKEFSFPIERMDSILILTHNVTTPNMVTSELEDTIIVDTVLYDFKYMLNYPVLLIKSLADNVIMTLKCSEQSAVILETENFFEPISYSVCGYDIGDSIPYRLLSNIEDCYDQDCDGIVEATLKTDEDVMFHLVEEKYIYKIKKSGISKDEVDQLIHNLNQTFNVVPDTIRRDQTNYADEFIWNVNGMYVTLSIIDIRQKCLSKWGKAKQDCMARQYFQSLADQYADMPVEYILEYNNSVLQSVLKYKYDQKAYQLSEK